MSEVDNARRGAIVRMTAGLLLLALIAVGCKSGDSGDTADTTPKGGNAGVVENTETPQPGGKIIYGLAAETNGWNPSASQWAPSGLEVAHSIFDTLSAYDSQSIIQPNLAAKFTHDDAYTTWTITLRPGITLHNGKPVTASVIKDNQEFLKQSTLTGSAYKPVDSFTTDGDLNVVVHMNEPWVNYPYALATQIGVVSDPDWLRSGDSAHPVGTGPFVFTSWTPEKELVVKKNPKYWQQGLPYLDEVDFRVLPDDDSRAASLENGTIDIMQTTSAIQIVKFKKLGEEGSFQVFNQTSGETSEVMIQLNGMKAPFDDIDARRALAYATDKKDFIDKTAEGLYEPANGPFPPSSPWYTATDYPQYDPAKAKELVDKYKAAHGGQFKFEVIGPPIPSVAQGLQLLQSQWAAVGMDVNINTVEQAPLIVKVLTGDYQATEWQQFDSPHPLGDSIWWHPDTAKPIPEFALNFARNKDDRIGKALDDGRRTTDKAQELADYQQVQKLLAEDVPYIWLYHSQISIVASNKLVNVVNYKLPPNENGEQHKGIEIQGGAAPLFQVWIRN